MRVDGRKIKQHRGTTPIEKVALAADLSARRIQQIEDTADCKLNTNVAKAIARVLGVAVADITAE